MNPLWDYASEWKPSLNAMKELLDAWKSVDRNKIALLMGIVPGLGHLYKHHYLVGFGFLIIGNVLVAFIAALLTLATAGLSLLIVPAAWFAAVACSAYMASDEHGHHPWLHVWNYHWSDFIHRVRKIEPPVHPLDRRS
jgi:hypothetical protein